MFKASLFLGAGCIIHAVHSNEMNAMGGLRKYMPVTHITFLIACLAISGIYPFSGFFSKDEILTAAFDFSPIMGWTMTAIAAMTAFYMFRLYYCIFWNGEWKGNLKDGNPHEAPLSMIIPILVLALITCVSGFIPFGEFISSDGLAYHIHLDPIIAITSISVAIIAIGIATWIYAGAKQPIAEKLATNFSTLHRAAYNRFYIDNIWNFITKKIIFNCVSRPIAWFDRHIVDGFLNSLASGTAAISNLIKNMQSGQVQHYAIWFLVGAVVLTLILIF
jgi:NADH-quinone oxidoreductase subunit L